jgi:hypothetical protein
MRAIVDKDGKPTQVMQLFSEQLAAFLANPVFENGIAFGNSDSTDPNVLNWSEENSFTPSAIGLTTAGTAVYSLRVGAGYRAGNRFFFQISLAWSGHTGTGFLAVSGLPFASSSTASFSPITCYTGGIVRAADEIFQAVTQPSMSNINVTKCAASGLVSGITIPASVTFLLLSGSYEI